MFLIWRASNFAAHALPVNVCFDFIFFDGSRSGKSCFSDNSEISHQTDYGAYMVEIIFSVSTKGNQ